MSPVSVREIAFGDHKGNLEICDLETGKSKTRIEKAHEGIINAIDGIGGKGPEYGAPEIVTGGRDGRNWK